MIPAEYYNLIYTIIVILFAIPVLGRYAHEGDVVYEYREKEPISSSLLFTSLIILFVGLRPNSPVFGDGPGYWAGIVDHRWEYVNFKDVEYQFSTKCLMSFLSSYNFSPRFGFIVFSTIVYGGALIAMRKMFPNDTLLAMLLFCGSFCVFGMAVNGIKNGMACSMFLCGVAYRENWKACMMFLLLSIGFHHSMQLSIGAFALCLFYKNTDRYYLVWFAALVLAILHVTFFQTLLAGFTDEHGASYLLPDERSWVSGFRLDFVLYSAAPLALGWWVKYRMNIGDSTYRFVLNVYLVMNAIWLLCMYASFTNRIATLSWSLFPVLILEPLLKEKFSNNQHNVLVWFIIGQFSFTLLMALLYL